MEARVGSVTEGHRLVLVLQKILDVAHLMVHCDQVIHSHNSALFDPGDTIKAKIARCLVHLKKLKQFTTVSSRSLQVIHVKEKVGQSSLATKQ